MRGAVVVAIVAGGCDDPARVHPHYTSPDARKSTLVVETIPMNIVLTEHSVSVYMEAVDFGDSDCVVTPFPTVGHCSVSVDGGPCWAKAPAESCITDLAIELDGQRLTPANFGGTDPWRYFYSERLDSGMATLVIAGCGHAEARIPLSGSALLQVQVSAVKENRDVRVTWATDQPASSAIAELSNGLFAPFCHVEGTNEYLFTNFGGAEWAQVSAISTRTELATDFGPATVWRAGTGSFELQ